MKSNTLKLSKLRNIEHRSVWHHTFFENLNVGFVWRGMQITFLLTIK